MLIESESTLEKTISIHSRYKFAKRLLDIMLTLLLLPLVCPVMLIIALLIRLDSKGPIIYRQRRVGQRESEFDFFKFRSMYVNSSDVAHRTAIEQYMNGQQINDRDQTANPYKLEADPRITRIGRFIRKTSLDELPQFFNVLRGEMSLVGPRPPLVYEVEHYTAYDKLRLIGKPGLTGVWQVYGRSRVTFQEMIEMDLAYLQQQSILLDLKIIFLTIRVMVLGRGGG